MRITFFIILLSLLNYPLWPQTGKISGFVYNGSADSTIIPDIEVNLLINKGHAVVDDSSYGGKTDAKGRFEFKNLPIDSTLLYYPRAAFNSIIYYGHAVQFTSKMNRFESDVVVYDTTSGTEKIVFQLEHLVIDAEPGKLFFREIFIAHNMGSQTFIGKNFNQPHKHYVLQFPLPEDFEDLEILTPEAKNWIRVQGQTLYHTELMSPGSRQFSYRFMVQNKKKQWHLSRSILYPLGAINILVSNPEIIIEGSGVTPMGDFVIRGKNYQRYSVSHLMPGMELNLTVKNLPGRSVSLQWLVLIGVIVLLLIGFGYTLSQSKS